MDKSLKWTKQQQDAIDARGQNLLVSAAAGSGKTAVLSERVARLVSEGTPLDRMLIITFTNAASAEMKERILARVGSDPFAKYSICTFDKFAIDICRSFYHVIDMPPGLKICDQYKGEIMMSDAMEELFEERLESRDEDFRDFLTHYCSPRSNEAAKEMIRALFTFIQSMPDPFAWLDAIEKQAFSAEALMRAASVQAEADLDTAIGFLRTAAELLGSKDDAGQPAMPALLQKNAADLDALERAWELLSGGRTEDAFALISELSFQTMRATKAETPYYEAVKESVKTVRDRAKEVVKKISTFAKGLSRETLEKELSMIQPWVRQLCLLVRDFSERFSAKKLREGLMDFSDAQHNALKILSDEGVCAELRDSYDYIFVDEYQDSNYVQEALISRISRGDNVFMVGDVKQSIYKFRQAEPEIFLKKYKDFRTGEDPFSRVIDLNLNYRSKAPVIDLINDVFRRIMTRQTVDMDYDENAELKEGSCYEGEYTYQPQLFLISTENGAEDEADEEIEELKAEELEALNAVRVIREYHGRMVNIKGADRKLRYSDMAILLRTAKNRGELYYQALQQSGIPVFLERGEGYFDTPEIQVFLNLLRIIDNPHQDVALISVMHFPSFGFCAADLARIKAEGKKTAPKASYYDTLSAFAGARDGVQQDIFGDGAGDADALAERACAFLEKLKVWRRRCACVPLADFLWELMHESGIALYAQALPGGTQRIANLRAMADRAETYESETSGGIGGFISYMEFIASSTKVDTGQVKLITESDDVVRIMTIHKSKGLEFPFVLLAGIGTRLGGRSDQSSMRKHRDLGVSLKLTDPRRGIKALPLSYRLIDSVLKAESYAEDIRVLYVAMTRARDILVMSAAVKDARELMSKKGLAGNGRAAMKSFLDMVLPSMKAADVRFLTQEELVTASEEHEKSREIREGIEKGFSLDEASLPVSMDELKERLGFDYSPDPSTLLKKKYSVSEIAELSRVRAGEALAQRPSSGISKKNGLSGAEKGTAYHSVMEHLPFADGPKTSEEIAGFIESLRQKHVLSDAEAEAVDPDRIAAFFESDIGKRAAAAEDLCKEAPFLLRTVLDGRTVFVQGVIDCYFREGDGYVLVDYKSNYVDRNDPGSEKERLKEHYEPQLALYKEALERILGVDVKESVLYLFGLDDAVTLED